MTIKSVILSGGSGTRLWPASRESYPKQLLPLTGERSLLQETALRLKDFPGGEVDPRPLVVTNEEYRFIIAEQLRQIGVRSPQIVLEPVGRNTVAICTNISCMLCGADSLVEHVEKKLGIRLGETTPDNRITLKIEEECLAACVGAPMMVVDGHYYTDLTPEKVDEVLDALD